MKQANSKVFGFFNKSENFFYGKLKFSELLIMS